MLWWGRNDETLFFHPLKDIDCEVWELRWQVWIVMREREKDVHFETVIRLDLSTFVPLGIVSQAFPLGCMIWVGGSWSRDQDRKARSLQVLDCVVCEVILTTGEILRPYLSAVSILAGKVDAGRIVTELLWLNDCNCFGSIGNGFRVSLVWYGREGNLCIR